MIGLFQLTKLKNKKLIEKTKVKLTLFELLTCIYVLSAKNTDDISFNLIESGLLLKKIVQIYGIILWLKLLQI